MKPILLLLTIALMGCVAQREPLAGTNGIRVEYASQAVIGGYDGYWHPDRMLIQLRYGAPDHTLAHECCHSGDSLGSYRHALCLVGNPAGLDRQLALAYRVADRADHLGGDHWRALSELCGNDAVQHPEIIARLKLAGLVVKAKK